MNIQGSIQLAKTAEKANKKFFQKLKRSKPANLDAIVHQLHDEVFEKIHCIECANCCKTTSPVFKQKDIDKLSRHFKIPAANFIDKFLWIDEDEDYVLKTAPCPFLGKDNFCTVYENRPEACREYPHTNRKKIHKILELTLKNTMVCPAVYQIVEGMKAKMR